MLWGVGASRLTRHVACVVVSVWLHCRRVELSVRSVTLKLWQRPCTPKAWRVQRQETVKRGCHIECMCTPTCLMSSRYASMAKQLTHIVVPSRASE